MKKIDEFYREARQRAKRRKSRWNLILIPLSITGVFASTFLLAKLLINIQSSMFPAKAILFSSTRVGKILMFVSVLFPSFGIGMIFANLIAWLISPARRTFEQEAKGYKNTSFKKSIKQLVIFTFCTFFIFMPVALLGSLNYFYVTEEGIYYNPLFSLSEKLYRWQDIKEIHTRCFAERKNLHLNYKLVMSDGRKIDLMEEPQLNFVRAYPRIKLFLDKQPNIRYWRNITERGVSRLYKRYKTEDARKILRVLQNKVR
ncbi:MAG: hypothetical protein D6734_10075 [Candidatus Schekmanbacteria bacterium]|nr:MAG: hypothetical protein D6734_10075 [Candidatus Schekmanbacteria bacterium]